MFRYPFLPTVATALVAYGVLGLLIATVVLIVGTATFAQVAKLQGTLDGERRSLVSSIQTVSGTIHDTASATGQFQQSIAGARDAAGQASQLASDSSTTFRALAAGLNVQILGIQPLASLTPQFTQAADQLQQLSTSLAGTHDALAQNVGDVQQVGSDLNHLQGQLDAVANSLNQPFVLGLGSEAALLPFQLVFYGMCALLVLQSVLSILGGIALFRLRRALGDQALLGGAGRSALPEAADGEPARLPVARS